MAIRYNGGGVRTEHDGYAEYCDKWCRVRDVVAGQDTVHAAGTKYLPRLIDQELSDYNAMVMRTPFYNASWRTIAGLIGMMFRKEPEIEVPDTVTELLQDVTMSGTPFTVFAQEVAEETMEVGRVGVMVDHPPTVDNNGEPITVARAQELGLRPTMQLYKAESIINWKFKTINNRYTLYMVVLKEDYTWPKSEFEDNHEDRYRVLDLEPETNTYRVRVFRINERDGSDELVSEVRPLMNGQPLNYIPFIFMSPDGVEADLDEPPLIDLVDLNLAHYRVTADYEHGCHFTGLPTPWIAGFQQITEEGKEPEKMYIGSSAAWVFPNADAKAEYLEFTGQGLGALERNLDRKEQQMAVLGARLLAAEKRQAETATTTAIHRTGENSILSSISIAVSLGLKQCLVWFTDWANADSGQVDYELNKNFLPVTIDAQTLIAYMQTWQAGGLSEEEFFDLLQSGDLIEADKTFEEHQAQIESNPPMAKPLARIGSSAGNSNPNNQV